MRKHTALLIQLDAKQAAGEFLDYGSSDFNAIFFTHRPPRGDYTRIVLPIESKPEMAEKLGTLFQLYYRPSRALSTILDSGSLGLAIVAAALAGFGLGRSVRDSVTGLLLIAVLFVPACVAIISVWDHLGSVSVVLRRDYSPLLVCVLMSWAAAVLPGAIAGFVAPVLTLWIWLAVILYFLALAAIAVRTVFGTGMGKAIGTVLGGLGATMAGYFAYATFGGVLSYFASPLVLIWLYILFRPNLDMFTGLGGGLRSRQNFNRHLEALTVNPHDSDAHYQLGLIYQQRRNYTEAISRFTKAVEIDPAKPMRTINWASSLWSRSATKTHGAISPPPWL